jgi:general stress protein 26
MEPVARRPFMPDYGIDPPDEGSGLLPWVWAEERLRSTRNFWLATRWPDGRPHVMPIWAVWTERHLWFSAGLHSRKVQNLLSDPRCAATTEDALNPVVVEGVASQVEDAPTKQGFLNDINAKYETNYQLDFLDPATTAVLRIQPTWAFGLVQDDFTGSPTRWQLDR